MPAKMISETPLPTASTGDLLARPHQDMVPPVQRRDGGDREERGRNVSTMHLARLQAHGDAEGLEPPASTTVR
jgi:hypothetical protein